MSMFAGLGSQISGFVSQKMGKDAAQEGEVPVDGQVPEQNGEGGEVPPEGQGGAMGSAMGFAQGLMMKANAVKDGVAAKAGALGGGNIQAPGPGEEGYVEGQEMQGEVPQEGMEGEQPPGAMGFAAGLMMKAHSLKEGVKEKTSGVNLGQVQGGIGAMAGGVMGQVSGIIPGMKREEDVPEPAPQEEYQEYTEDGQQYEQYQEQQYTE